jgi:hypothetical protein
MLAHAKPDSTPNLPLRLKSISIQVKNLKWRVTKLQTVEDFSSESIDKTN